MTRCEGDTNNHDKTCLVNRFTCESLLNVLGGHTGIGGLQSMSCYTPCLVTKAILRKSAAFPALDNALEVGCGHTKTSWQVPRVAVIAGPWSCTFL